MRSLFGNLVPMLLCYGAEVFCVDYADAFYFERSCTKVDWRVHSKSRLDFFCVVYDYSLYVGVAS